MQTIWERLPDLPFEVGFGAACEVLNGTLYVVAGAVSDAAVRWAGTFG